MIPNANFPCLGYFPAIVRVECDSPIDALVAACIPRHEAMDLVAASWSKGGTACIVATLDGGRQVVVLRTPEGRWAVQCLPGQALCYPPGGRTAIEPTAKTLSPGLRGLPGEWLNSTDGRGWGRCPRTWQASGCLSERSPHCAGGRVVQSREPRPLRRSIGDGRRQPN